MTTAFWNLPYADRFEVKGEPALEKNYYHGKLYQHGQEYRDDTVDVLGVEVLGILRATVSGIDEDTMAFVSPQELPGSLSHDVYISQLAGGWSSLDHDADGDSGNCAVAWEGVTQHYLSCWEYNLGADADTNLEGAFWDRGWGPHIENTAITQINANAGSNLLTPDHLETSASRVTRISRFTRW
jgi:hypothetical protein